MPIRPWAPGEPLESSARSTAVSSADQAPLKGQRFFHGSISGRRAHFFELFRSTQGTEVCPRAVSMTGRHAHAWRTSVSALCANSRITPDDDLPGARGPRASCARREVLAPSRAPSKTGLPSASHQTSAARHAWTRPPMMATAHGRGLGAMSEGRHTVRARCVVMPALIEKNQARRLPRQVGRGGCRPGTRAAATSGRCRDRRAGMRVYGHASGASQRLQISRRSYSASRQSQVDHGRAPITSELQRPRACWTRRPTSGGHLPKTASTAAAKRPLGRGSLLPQRPRPSSPSSTVHHSHVLGSPSDLGLHRSSYAFHLASQKYLRPAASLYQGRCRKAH